MQNDPEFREKCLKQAMKVLKEACQEIAGDVPDSFVDRMRMLFTAVAQISVLTVRWAAEEAGDPNLDEERNRAAATNAIADIVSCAVIVAERFSHERSTAPEFSSN